jgi:hypothetical protein
VLTGIWRECFLAAWESFRVGSVPVGAVLVGPDGMVVTRGRNRFNEAAGPPGEVAGSYIARWWTRREGPLTGPLRTLGGVLPLISSVERGIRSVVERHAETMPDVLRLAERLAGAPAARLRTMTLDQAAAEILRDNASS